MTWFLLSKICVFLCSVFGDELHAFAFCPADMASSPSHWSYTAMLLSISRTQAQKAGLKCIPHRGGASKLLTASHIASQSLWFPPVSNSPPPHQILPSHSPTPFPPFLLLPKRGCSPASVPSPQCFLTSGLIYTCSCKHPRFMYVHKQLLNNLSLPPFIPNSLLDIITVINLHYPQIWHTPDV